MRNFILMLFLMLFSSVSFSANKTDFLPKPTEQKVFIESSIQSPVVADYDIGGLELSNDSIIVTLTESVYRLNAERLIINKQKFVNNVHLKKAGTARIHILMSNVKYSYFKTFVNTNRIRCDG